MPFGTPLVDVVALKTRIRALPLEDRLRLAERLLELDPELSAAIAEDVVAELRAGKRLRKRNGPTL